MQKTRKPAALLALATLAALGLAVASPRAAHAQIFTDSAAFTAAMGTGAATAYTETFTGTTGTGTASIAFSSNGYSYNVTSTGGVVYRSGTFIGANSAANPLVFTFTGGTVTAIGGNFFGTSSADAFLPSTIVLTFSDGQTTTFSSATINDFRGYISTVPITSLTIPTPVRTTGTGTDFATADNLIVGTAAVAASPEPTQTAALGMGVLGIAGLALKARQRKRVA